MFRVIKKILAMISLVSSVNSLKCALIKNQECKVRKKITTFFKRRVSIIP